jgi:cell division cycle protein 20 (cofactor of APC complex)
MHHRLKWIFILILLIGLDNTVAIALGPDVFLWNAESASISQLATRAKADWTSVSWASRGFYLALGTQQGEIEIHDTGVGKKLRTMIVGDARVPVCHWSTTTPHLVASACGSEVCISDVRARNHHVGTLTNGHEQEVIGLKWAPSGNQIATGGNDNRVCIWDVSSSLHTSPKHILRNHCAGVKAVAWCPWQSDLLATGGGNADRTIRFWNSSTGIQLNTIDTNSQISSLQWSKNPACKEIVSAHGYSKCELNVWQYPSLVKAAELHGHQERILSSCVSLDGTTVCTAGADETIRFWNIWPAKVHQKKKNEEASKLMKMLR